MWIHLVIVEVKLHYSWYLSEVRQPRYQEQSTLTQLSIGCWGYMCSSINGKETQSYLFIHWSWALTSNMKFPDKFHRSPLAWAQGPKRNFKSWTPLPTFPLEKKKNKKQFSVPRYNKKEKRGEYWVAWPSPSKRQPCHLATQEMRTG